MRNKGFRQARDWWLSPSDVKECVSHGIRACGRVLEEIQGAESFATENRCNGRSGLSLLADALHPARVDMQKAAAPARYLAKYVSKNESGLGGASLDGWENLVPHQWHHCSVELARLERAGCVQLPPEFADWVWSSGHRLAQLGLGRCFEWSPCDDGGYRITTFAAASPAAMASVWELFLSETRYGRWIDADSPPVGGDFLVPDVLACF
jgi:hypothetical protein